MGSAGHRRSTSSAHAFEQHALRLPTLDLGDAVTTEALGKHDLHLCCWSTSVSRSLQWPAELLSVPAQLRVLVLSTTLLTLSGRYISIRIDPHFSCIMVKRSEMYRHPKRWMTYTKRRNNNKILLSHTQGVMVHRTSPNGQHPQPLEKRLDGNITQRVHFTACAKNFDLLYYRALYHIFSVAVHITFVRRSSGPDLADLRWVLKGEVRSSFSLPRYKDAPPILPRSAGSTSPLLSSYVRQHKPGKLTS